MSTNRIARQCFLGLAVLLAVLIHAPAWDFVSQLAQGDRGHDLYAFYRTLQGGIPYRDYYWIYGPLPPYFYALCFKLFGVRIPSILLGEIFLKILCGLALYASLALFIELPAAFTGAVWFWAFNPWFFHTSNHVFGVSGILWTIFLVFKYIEKPAKKWIWWMQAPLFAVFFTKYNIGLSTLAASAVCIFMADCVLRRVSFNKKIANLLPFALLSAVAAAGYAWIIRGLPAHYLGQCFPTHMHELTGRHPLLTRLEALYFFITVRSHGALVENYGQIHFSARYLPWAVSFLVMAGAAFTLYWLKAGQNLSVSGKKILLALASALLFSVFSLHEFILTNFNYTIFWATPILLLFSFLAGGWILARLPRPAKVLILLLLGLSIAVEIQKEYVLKEKTERFRKFLFFSHPKAGVYLNNPPDWLWTVGDAADYLEQNLGPDETFLALPYDSLYYYLTGKENPVRWDCFFNYIGISEEEERQIIAALEAKKVNYVLVSNRSVDRGGELGVFGETYGRVLAAYLTSHFEQTQVFGDWRQKADWAKNHAVIIYKRKSG